MSLSAVCEKKKPSEVRASVLGFLDAGLECPKRATHLDVDTLELGNDAGESTGLVDGAGRHLLLGDDSVRDGDPVVVLSEGGRLVDETGSGVLGDVGVADDSEGSVLKLKEERSGWKTRRGQQACVLPLGSYAIESQELSKSVFLPNHTPLETRDRNE